jgi:hypothetical protein
MNPLQPASSAVGDEGLGAAVTLARLRSYDGLLLQKFKRAGSSTKVRTALVRTHKRRNYSEDTSYYAAFGSGGVSFSCAIRGPER